MRRLEAKLADSFSTECCLHLYLMYILYFFTYADTVLLGSIFLEIFVLTKSDIFYFGCFHNVALESIVRRHKSCEYLPCSFYFFFFKQIQIIKFAAKFVFNKKTNLSACFVNLLLNEIFKRIIFRCKSDLFLFVLYIRYLLI